VVSKVALLDLLPLMQFKGEAKYVKNIYNVFETR
jgi:hypothetical protein